DAKESIDKSVDAPKSDVKAKKAAAVEAIESAKADADKTADDAAGEGKKNDGKSKAWWKLW
ncbi:MAG: hypothetical protein GX280_08555, partial [Lentisphaerae bacterium]|nr:hypothetical protein [Victivallaceae bacterium]NLK84108.1 hypothetical protein [Lentisphaerota bacterium]